MKNIISILFTLLVTANIYSQQSKIPIDPDQNKNKQYIGVSSNGKKLFSSRNLKYGEHEIKGFYKGILLTDFANALANYIDSLGLVGGSGSDSANIFNEPVTKDRIVDYGLFDLDLKEINTFEFNNNSEGRENLNFDFDYNGNELRIETNTNNGMTIAVNGDGFLNLSAGNEIQINSSTFVTLGGDLYAPNVLSAVPDLTIKKLVVVGNDTKLSNIDVTSLPTEAIVYDIGMNGSGELVQEEVTGGGGGTYEDICGCYYLHMVFQFNGTSDPTVTKYDSNIDFDITDPGLGNPIVVRSSSGEFIIKSAQEPLGDILIGTQGDTYIRAEVRSNPNVYMLVGSYNASDCVLGVYNRSDDTPNDPTSFYYGEISFEFPKP